MVNHFAFVESLFKAFFTFALSPELQPLVLECDLNS
jgi:hypothetical protein